MPELSRTKQRISIIQLACDALFYGIFLSYFIWWVDPRLIYISQEPVFQTGWEYFRPFLNYPGGFMEYVNLGLGQLNAWGWPGALAMTAVAFMVAKMTKSYLLMLCRTANTSRPSGGPAAVQRQPDSRLVAFMQYLPPVMLLMLYTSYDALQLAAPSLAAMLAMAVIYCRLAGRPLAVRLPAYAVCLVVVYYFLAGSTVFGTLREPAFQMPGMKINMLLTVAGFALLCGLRELRAGCAWLLPVYIVLAAGAVMLGEDMLTTNGIGGLKFWDTLSQFWLYTAGALIIVPLEAVGLVVGQRLYSELALLWQAYKPRRIASQPSQVAKAHAGKPDIACTTGSQSGSSLRIEPVICGMMILLTIMCGAVRLSWDGVRERELRFDYYRTHEMWNEILLSARRLPSAEFGKLTHHDVNMSLFETGRLAYDMFDYPQFDTAGEAYDMLIPFEDRPSYAYLYRLVDQNIRLGRLNDAEHFSFEAMALVGPRASLLAKLAMIKMVKGQLPAARIFLNRLAQNIVYCDWARRYLNMMDQTGDVADDRQVAAIRSVRLMQDDVAEVVSFQADGVTVTYYDRILQNLLKQNPRNKMAFEYLMGLYMLARLPSKVAENAAALDYMEYPDLPRHYAEAMVSYQVRNNAQVKLPDRYRISQHTIDQYKQMIEIALKYGNNPSAAFDKIEELGLKNTYFFYAMAVPKGAGQ